MNIEWRTTRGEAGDLQEMLIGKTETNDEACELFTSTGIWRALSMRIAKRRITKQLRINRLSYIKDTYNL